MYELLCLFALYWRCFIIIIIDYNCVIFLYDFLVHNYQKYFVIGLYMPAVCLMVGALFIKACAQWYQLQENPLAQG